MKKKHLLKIFSLLYNNEKYHQIEGDEILKESGRESNFLILWAEDLKLFDYSFDEQNYGSIPISVLTTQRWTETQ